ncbi:MAG: hypothetical protein NTY17_08360 [Planctomycetia bacterium]|nr:hypothetical protein [Planctomycetia bacterium]
MSFLNRAVVSAVFPVVMVTAFSALAPCATAADSLAASGVAMIPEDAAFVSATLRAREQYDRFVKSNAFAALKKLPFVSRAADSVEEQKLQPGSPLSIAATFMELPENEQALQLLKDMVATDTFVYGEPSCVTFVELMKKIQQAQNAAGVLRLASGDASVGGFEVDVLEGIDVEEMDEDDDDEEEDGKKGAADTRRRLRAKPVRFQAADAAEQISADELATRLVVKTLSENINLIVVPDVVWGFKTTKLDAATSQLKRIEVLVKLITQTNPALADSLKRRKVAGGEVVTFTIKPDANLIRDAIPGLEDYEQELEKVFDKIERLELVIGLGVIGDRVILTIGDSIDHLEKLAVAGSDRKSLLATKPFEPLRAQKDKPLTGISYLSEAMQKALAPSSSDIEQLADLSDTIADLADLPDGAADEARRSLGKVAEGYKRRLPVPGPWMAFSFLSEQGYEGYVWDWSKNLPFDGSKRLGLLEHTGGAPLAAAAFRVKNDPGQFEDFASWVDMGWSFFLKYLVPKADEDDQEKIEEVDEHLAPLGSKFVGIVRTKILPSLADGQMAFVIDGKSSTKRLHQSLPSAAEPLPLVEPAIVLGLADPKLFREAMSDLFELSDEVVDAVREMNPDALPAEYRVPEPVKNKVEGGTLWSYPLANSGLDEKVQPSIGVGESAAVLSLVPKQAGRLLLKTRLETGSRLAKFEEPLVGAAALDWAGLIDAIQPWAVYFTRYGCVQQRDGNVDPESELGPDDENEQAKDALAQAKVVFEVIKSLRVAVAETAMESDAMVTHWRNVIRDMPAK